MLKFSFVQDHLSIKKFDPINVPRLSILTGFNGSGKTQFFSALDTGCIRAETSDGEIVRSSEILRLNFNVGSHFDASPGNGSGPSPSEQETLAAYRRLSQRLQMKIGEAFAKLDDELKPDIAQISPMFPAEILSAGVPHRSDPRFTEFFIAVDSALREMHESIALRFGNQALNKLLAHLEATGTSLFRVDDAYLLATLLADRTGRLFQSGIRFQIDEYIQRYRALKVEAKDAWWKTGSANRDVVAQLTSEMGRPWKILNDVYEKAGFDLVIAEPDLEIDGRYEIEFTREAGARVFFVGLSTGEQIAATIGMGMYQVDPSGFRPFVPRLLLLDEVDAPLHPHYTRKLLRLLKELAETYDIHVILATHSPTTVALAPEDGIFEKLRGGGLRPLSKGAAINRLLEGVPAVALDFEGRRQVFVEAPSDAKIYSFLYTQVRSKLQSDRSLEFVNAGTRNHESKEEGGGCANAKRIVRELSNSGNKSVFGLVDGDGGKNRHEPRIFVLGGGSRYAIENYLFDPLLVAAGVCRESPSCAETLGISKGMGLHDLQNLPIPILQDIANRVQETILGEINPDATVRYAGNFELQLDRRCLDTNGHQWAKECIQKLPCLKALPKHSQGATIEARVSEALAMNVARDVPNFVPIEIRETFNDLLQAQLNEEADVRHT